MGVSRGTLSPPGGVGRRPEALPPDKGAPRVGFSETNAAKRLKRMAWRAVGAEGGFGPKPGCAATPFP